MQKKQYLCKRITKKKTALLLWRRGAVGGKRKCIVFEETKAPKGENTFIFRVQRYCFYLIYANFPVFFLEKVDFYV